MNKPSGGKDQIDFSAHEKPTCPYCEQPATTALVDDTSSTTLASASGPRRFTATTAC